MHRHSLPNSLLLPFVFTFLRNKWWNPLWIALNQLCFSSKYSFQFEVRVGKRRLWRPIPSNCPPCIQPFIFFSTWILFHRKYSIQYAVALNGKSVRSVGKHFLAERMHFLVHCWGNAAAPKRTTFTIAMVYPLNCTSERAFPCFFYDRPGFFSSLLIRRRINSIETIPSRHFGETGSVVKLSNEIHSYNYHLTWSR